MRLSKLEQFGGALSFLVGTGGAGVMLIWPDAKWFGYVLIAAGFVPLFWIIVRHAILWIGRSGKSEISIEHSKVNYEWSKTFLKIGVSVKNNSYEKTVHGVRLELDSIKNLDIQKETRPTSPLVSVEDHQKSVDVRPGAQERYWVITYQQPLMYREVAMTPELAEALKYATIGPFANNSDGERVFRGRHKIKLTAYANDTPPVSKTLFLDISEDSGVEFCPWNASHERMDAKAYRKCFRIRATPSRRWLRGIGRKRRR